MIEKLNKLIGIREVLNSIQGLEREDIPEGWYKQVSHFKQHLDLAIDKLDVLVKKEEKIKKDLEAKKALEAQKVEGG